MKKIYKVYFWKIILMVVKKFEMMKVDVRCSLWGKKNSSQEYLIFLGHCVLLLVFRLILQEKGSLFTKEEHVHLFTSFGSFNNNTYMCISLTLFLSFSEACAPNVFFLFIRFSSQSTSLFYLKIAWCSFTLVFNFFYR